MSEKKLEATSTVIVGSIISAIMIVMTVCFILVAVLEPLSQRRSARSWIEIPCIITRSEESVVITDAVGFTKADIHYKFLFNDKQYEHDRVIFPRDSDLLESMRGSLLEKYKVGTEHTCFVNPSDPSEAVLIRDFSLGDINWIAIIFLSLVCLLFTVLEVYMINQMALILTRKKSQNVPA